MDHKTLAEKLWQAISDQADDDGGVVHKGKATEAIERALAKLMPETAPAYEGFAGHETVNHSAEEYVRHDYSRNHNEIDCC